MNLELTEEEVRECAELLHKRYGRSVEFYIGFITEDPWKESREYIAKHIDELKPVDVPPKVPVAA